MAAPSTDNQKPSYVGPNPAIPGKPQDTEFPTPNLRDRILVIRQDSRKAGYKVPLQGSKYEGPNAEKFCDFRFATIKSLDQIGWVNFYYINERRNQDQYNFQIDYPYASKDYPTVTRTYVVLRGDQRTKEPDADTKDPVYGDLYLTDHKIIRLDKPELDALFVGVQRVYERLPSPIIISAQMNDKQQEVVVFEQEDINPSFPSVNAKTEIAKVERKTTAKAKTTLGTVDQVFPDTNYVVSRDDAVIPYRHRKFLAALPSIQVSGIEAGNATIPTLSEFLWQASDHQITKYKHQLSQTARVLSAPISLREYRLTNEQQLSTVNETWARGLQTVTPAPLLIEADSIQLGNHESIKSETTIPSVFPQSVFETEIPDPVPQRFRVKLPLYTTTQTGTGDAALPVLGTGEIARRDEQTKVFWHRLMAKGRDVSHLPTSLVSYELTPEQQIGTVKETLATGLQTLTPNARYVKASVDNLGNDTSLKSTTIVPNVFQKIEYSAAVSDATPEKFRAAIPILEGSASAAGQAQVPVLGTGELERRDVQEKDFVHRLTVRGRFPVLPVSLVSYEMTPEQQLGTVKETLKAGLQTLSLDAQTIKASVDNLGNQTSLKSTTRVPNVFSKAEYSTSIPDVLPAKFRVTIPTQEGAITASGTAQLPVLGTGELERRDIQEKEFTHRLSVRSRANVVLPVSLKSYELTPEQQIGTITETYNSGLQTLSPSATLIKGSVENLGNGTSLKSRTSVPFVFPKTEYTVSIPDILPERFRVAIPTVEGSITEAGAAQIPVLQTGDLEVRDVQEKAFTHRVTVRNRPSAVFPTTLISYKMTREKQIETVFETLDAGLQTISPNAVTIEAEVSNLGNGTSLATVGTVPILFPESSFEKSIPDLVPPEFKALVPSTTVEVNLPGQASFPVLGTGDISKTEKQLNDFVFRRRTESRTGFALPKSFSNPELTREFGGGTTNVVRTLNIVGSQLIDDDFLVLRSEIKNLGNGMELKETQKAQGSAWPILTSILWDDNMRVTYTETKQVVDATIGVTGPDPGGNTFAWLSELKSVDKWRSILINTNKPAPPYQGPDTALITREFRPYRFPGYLRFSGTGYYTRAAEAVLVEHVIRTWWAKSTSAPTIAYDRIITGDVIINNLANTGLEYARNVLHDGFSFGVLSYPPTTPSASEYAGTQIAPGRHNVASRLSVGTSGHQVGDIVHINYGAFHMQVTVTEIYDVGEEHGFILNTTVDDPGGTFPPGTYGPIFASGATWSVISIDVPAVSGGPWIGTERIIDASVVPEKEPNIWKCQTKSVVMQ